MNHTECPALAGYDSILLSEVQVTNSPRQNVPPTRFRSIMCGIAALLLSGNVLADEATSPQANVNRLSQESSPYLLLHAHNPVDWYPWGPEAFEKAKQEQKPIFLSIGYSSCYWCHVMERKVFTNAEIAKYMNEHFVNIKVDREERPDVDDIYMTSLLVYNQLVGSPRGGGWPLSMFLTPDGNPIAGATYLAPEDSPETGPGFSSVATRITTLWKERQSDLTHTAELIAAQVQRMTKPGVGLEHVELDGTLLDAAMDQVRKLYDPVWGGVDFNSDRPNSPRFPNVPRLELALDIYESKGDKEILKIVEHSLNGMAHGGIRDHLGGGFHRYSTDRRWHVPHFEKMLYDQAMLLGIYTRAATLMNSADFRQVAVEIADFIHREMTTTDGAFCSALDAETNAIEGEYYVWSQKEVDETLGSPAAEMFSAVYGLNESNTFEHGFVLHLPAPISDAAKTQSLSAEQLSIQLNEQRAKLLQARSKRERPLLDDKVLTSWNALMIKTLAISGRELDRPQDTAAAAKAAEFLLEKLRRENGHLLRTYRNGTAKYSAYLDDYAFLVDALLELHRSTNEPAWLSHAQNLATIQNELFYDDQLQAFYFTASNHEKLIARTSSVYDSVFPAANSISIGNLLRLSELTDAPELKTIATNTLTRFAPTLQKSPAACSGLARALHLWLALAKNEETQSGVSVAPIRRRYVPAVYRATTEDETETESPSAATQANEDSPESPTVIEHTAFKPVMTAEPASPFVKDDKPKPVKVKVYPMYDKLERGGKCLVAIELTIKLGWHINANPSSPDFLVPTKVEIKTDQKVKLTKTKYPEHHELKVLESDEPYHVYDGKVMVYGLLEIDEAELADAADLEFHVTFQGCNSSECLPPDKIVMKGKLPLASKGEELKKINETKFPKPKSETDPPEDDDTK